MKIIGMVAGTVDGGLIALFFLRDPEEGKKKGTLIVRNGFKNFLAPSLNRGHCPPFHVLGHTCIGECTKRHAPMARWSRADKDAQITHVERNKDHILFHASFSCFLPDEKKYLISLTKILGINIIHSNY